MDNWSLSQTNLSGLLSEAYACVLALEGDPRYQFSVHSWHEPRSGVCHIDLAGALMACKLQADPDKELEPEDFPEMEKLAFYALDCLATGSISGAATRWRKVARALGMPYDYKAGLALRGRFLVPAGSERISEDILRETIALLREHKL